MPDLVCLRLRVTLNADQKIRWWRRPSQAGNMATQEREARAVTRVIQALVYSGLFLALGNGMHPLH